MVISRTDIKRKRKEGSENLILDDSPKRTKVHAQRKFAQGSNVSSPVITPVKEIEKQDKNKPDVLPEPVELLPIKRPHTEDFLTFLCFRGTPILPSGLNFFNTSSVLENGVPVPEMKKEQKNGPIATSTIIRASSGNSSEKPFIAFGVRKRADPMVISKQMDKKRRHALALQALRRKYEEQKMAKIRAVTISKLSERVQNKTSLRTTRSATKNETFVKRNLTTKTKVKVIATKHVKIATKSSKLPIKAKIKPKMCLRSFRGRFVQCELQHKSVKKRTMPAAKFIVKKVIVKATSAKKRNIEKVSDFSSDDDQPLLETAKQKKTVVKTNVRKLKVAKKSTLLVAKKPSEINFRMTRSGNLHHMIPSHRQKMKKKLLLIKTTNLNTSTARITRSSQKLNNLKKLKATMELRDENNHTKDITERIKESENKGNKKDLETDKKTIKEELNCHKTDPNSQLKKINKKDLKVELKDIRQKDINIGKPDVKMGSPESEKKNAKQDKKDGKVEKNEINTMKPEKDKTKDEINKDVKKNYQSKKDYKKTPISEKILKTKPELTVAQRPTRKTKEAAAIYMEILGHKLVHEDDIDDDSVSIDSFPELPNVRKTEQRENELKAKANSKIGSKENDIEKMKLRPNKDSTNPKLSVKNVNKDKEANTMENHKQDIETKINVKVTNINQSLKKVTPFVSVEKKSFDKFSKETASNALNKPHDEEKNIKTRSAKKANNDLSEKVSSKTKNSIEKEIISKCNFVKNINTINENKDKQTKETLPKRITRLSQNQSLIDESDSDKSFYADVQIPRLQRKLSMRNKKSKSYQSFSNSNSSIESLINENLSKLTKKESDSECSTTSNAADKKITEEIKSSKLENSFNDSDEEPLSKLTLKKIEDKNLNLLKEDPKMKNKIVMQKELKETTKNQVLMEKKPKRECTKRPQNYMTLFSSSDDEDYKCFHGFVKSDAKSTQNSNDQDNKCSHSIPSADLLYKDVGRRFGKGKVNMSNEQIEKWLKESAMAGTSLKRENDEMLKFGEKIPTETCPDLRVSDLLEKDVSKMSSCTDDISKILITQKVLNVCGNEKVAASTSQELGCSSNSSFEKPPETKVIPKPHFSIDRKLIFKKEKKISAPNVNAFSANNESSVYAFGEENEDMISTPFRRPNRRPSSTATSRSEDEILKADDGSKHVGKFRVPITKAENFKTSESKSVLAGEMITNNSIAIQVSLENFEQSNDAECSAPVYDDSEHLKSSKQIVQENIEKPKTLLKPKVKESINRLSTSMCPPANVTHKLIPKTSGLRNSERNSENFEELKHKIPSSPSASSSSSTKLYKRMVFKPRARPLELCISVNVKEFPSINDSAQMVEAPVFHPNEKEFQDPIEFIDKIRAKAEKFGICRIVPPANFKPECKVTDDMRFTAYNQYVHKMLRRWGPNFKELMAIKKYLATQNITLNHPPWIGGMEIDLPRLYQTVQNFGGLKEVIEKKKWPKVSESMKIPKSAQDRVTKLDDIYCKYLLPYDTLSPVEREKLFHEVETDWAKRESRTLLKAQQKVSQEETADLDSETDDEAEECIVKGRSMALNAFYRIARNTMSMWFKSSEPTAQQVEQEFWKHVTVQQNHICVHCGSIDSGNWGYGFAVSKNSPFARHAWNLKVLTNNSGSVLRSMGPIMGVTVPTLHVGMVFSACCWYRDPHSLPWIEYLHTGGNKIWYGIPDSMSDVFRNVVTKLVPNYCVNKSLWLPSDTAMVPPNLLIENGVSLCRTVQEPGQFIVIFPKTFTSSISTGYVVSESVYFAPPYWLKTARKIFDELRHSCEPSMFSLDRLLLSISIDPRSSVDVLKQIIPAVEALCAKERKNRTKLHELGVTVCEKLPLPESLGAKKRKKLQGEDGDYECEVCRMNLFVSLVKDLQEDGIYCLDHAIKKIKENEMPIKNCMIMYTYSDEELDNVVHKMKLSIENKLQKKVPGKYAGMPTLLK